MTKSTKTKQIKKISKKLNHLDIELKSVLNISRTKTDHFLLYLIKALGSIRFLVLCFIFFFIWICLNLHFLSIEPFDPFPFPILDMIVSVFAIILSVSVLINQNRQKKIDELKSQVEFEINVRAESEITKILNMLHEMHQKMGLDSHGDDELEKMKEQTDIQKIHHTLTNMEETIDELAAGKEPK